MSTEPRTLILADDGRHVTLGHNSQPTEAEIAAAADALRAQGIGAWLVEMTGSYYGRGKVALRMVREVAAPRAEYAAAEAAFQAARNAARGK